MLIDVILELLRTNTPESLAEASKLAGVEIKKCPPCVPVWPPKPVAKKPEKRVVKRERNPCLPTTDAFQRFRYIRVGMTREELKKRGISARDIRTWTNQGAIQWSA